MKPFSPLVAIATALLLAWCTGIVTRGYWTPDEPREADLAWRMSWQADKAVPSLAGEAFCEKPPLAYWIAGASMAAFGTEAWAPRLPNLLYALLVALSVGAIARRAAGPAAGLTAAAAVSSFLLSYQTGIWLATDAPLVAAVCVALLGLYRGFYAADRRERRRGYWLMHAALAAAFLVKSAAAFLVPVLALLTLVAWERRWRELLRVDLLAGALLPVAAISIWAWFVYRGSDGPAHLRVFFWNNLVGRFAEVRAAGELQYAAGHRNSPGKYLLELPVYLWPWTLLVLAAARRAWRGRAPGGEPQDERRRLLRFAVAASVPALVVLSCAATARNIYLAPALPGAALLLGWWTCEAPDAWDRRAIRGSAVLLLAAAVVVGAALPVIGADARAAGLFGLGFAAAWILGVGAGIALAAEAWRAARAPGLSAALTALLLSYCALLIGPASQAYADVNTWQDLAAVAHAVQRDAAGAPLLLFAPDETTRAVIDMDARRRVVLIPGPADAAAVKRLQEARDSRPRGRVLVQLPGRVLRRPLRDWAQRLGLDREAARPTDPRPVEGQPPEAPGSPGQTTAAAIAPLLFVPTAAAAMPAWVAATDLRPVKIYALPNGRRYALLESRR